MSRASGGSPVFSTAYAMTYAFYALMSYRGKGCISEGKQRIYNYQSFVTTSYSLIIVLVYFYE